MDKKILEFPDREEKQHPEISLEKTLKIGSLQVSAEKVSKATDEMIRLVGGVVEEDERHFAITLVVPKIFGFGTDVAKMIADMWLVADEVIMVGMSSGTRMTFTVRDIHK